MIIPVILENNLDEIVNKLRIAEEFAGVVQIDFCDGVLVNGRTYLDIDKVNEIATSASLDIHLMVLNPLDYLKKRINNAVKICSQIEAPGDPNQFIERAKELGYKVGLSINPDTDYRILEAYLDRLDYVQFMDIVPGAQGRSLLPQVIEQIREFRAKHPSVRIQVDGGVKVDNIDKLIEAGVNDFVVGSAIFKDENPIDIYIKLNHINELKNPKVIESLTTLKKRKIRMVAFLGGAAWKETDEPYKEAYDVAKVLAENDYLVVNGGGPGVMRASTKGAHAAEGHVIAITYHPNKPKRHYEGVDPENDFDDEIITLDYFDRTKVMLQTTQAHIVFRGSIGTLSEYGMTWISSWIHEPDSKPIVLYGHGWEEFLDMIKKQFLVHHSEDNMFKICKTPQEVLEFINQLN